MKTSKFQLIIFIVFILFIAAGVAAFATYKGSSSGSQLPTITVWGTFPKDVFDQCVIQVGNSLSSPISVKYVQESPDAFLQDFISALARGAGPDAVLIPADMILPAEDKLVPIPYSALPQASFKSAYIDESFVYLGSNGVMAVPFAVDPIVMYWDRDMFDAAGIASPPKYWDDFANAIKKITVKNENGTVTRSAVAMGDFTNVVNARELLGSLFLQLGNPITVQASDGSVSSALKTSAKADPTPALQFFAGFVDPTSDYYSWNRSWPDSKTAFLAGSLATYFGFASELADIRSKNPNLNFDVTALPEARSGGTTAVYGKLYGFSLVKASPNNNAAYEIISTLTMPQYLVKVSDAMYLPSVSRDVIASGSTDQYITIFNQAALISRTWLDADPAKSGQIFGSMVQAVVSGQRSASQAVSDAGNQYDAVLRQATGQ